MKSLFKYLKQGLTRTHSKDRIGGTSESVGLRTNLRNLRPFVSRHWRKGLLGSLLVILTSLLSFPQPLITRYLLDHVLRLPKSFFDANQTGYLMSRLSSDVQGLRWFFSSTIVYIFSNCLRFMGGIAFLIYLEWRLAIGVLAILPPLVFFIRYFSKKIHVLSRQSMEQHVKVSGQFQESLSSVSLIKSFSSEMRTVGRLISESRKEFQISLEQSTVGSVAHLIISSTPGIARG